MRDFESGLDRPFFAHERSMVKAALLYADHVSLVSPRVAFLSRVISLDARPEDFKYATEIADGYAAHLRHGGTIETLPQAVRDYLGGLTSEERKYFDVFMSARAVEGVAERILSWQRGMAELGRATRTGLLDIDVFETAPGQPERIVREGVPLLDSALGATVTSAMADMAGDGSRLAVLDTEASELIGWILGTRPPGSVRDGLVEAAISDRLIRSVEAFPDAELDGLLDVRTRLEGPLTRFRSAIVQLAKDARSLPWSPDFDAEVDALYRGRVAPALLEVAEGLAELGARPTLLRTASSQAALAAAGSSLGLAAAAVGSGLTGAAAALTGAPIVTVAAAVATELRERARIRKQVRRNDFYLLAELRQSLPGAAPAPR